MGAGPLNRDYVYVRNRKALKKQVLEEGAYCWMCGQPIDMTIKYPDPMSWSCQHIVPRTRGGTSEMDNLASAHKMCQDSEGHRLGIGGVAARGAPIRRSRVWH